MNIRKINRMLSLTAVLVVAIISTPALAVDDLSLVVAPGSETGVPGAQVSVQLHVANLSAQINAAQVLIHYDNTKLQLVNISPTPGIGGVGWTEGTELDIAGDITYVVALNGGATQSDHDIATLLFNVIAEGTTNVTFRVDNPPILTKLVKTDNTVILPNKFDSGNMILTCDDGNACTTDTVVSQACQNVAVTNGTICDDGNACNIGETCQAGACSGGAAPDCSGTGDQCNADSICDAAGAEGNCDTAGGAINEGVACDDTLVCNVGETCQAGACSGGAAPDCSGTGDQCNADSTCDAVGAEGNCDTAGGAINEGLSCDDTLACNVGETCQAGACSGGAAPDCSGAGDQCNTASCDGLGLEGNCDTLTPVLDGTTCDDGAACNTGEACQTGICTGGAAQDCSGAGDQCNSASCDTLGLEGNCDTITPVLNGTVCDDSAACNTGESCQTGVCTGGAAPDCSGAGDQCNSASCDAIGLEGNCDTLTPINEGVACDDTLACNVGESCQAGVCSGGAAPDCSGTGDQCNADSTCDAAGLEDNCDTAGGAINEGLACDDADVCTETDVCTVGVCAGIDPSARITVNVQVDALNTLLSPVIRDVSFVITECAGGTTDSRVVPVTFDLTGTGSATLSGVDPTAEWISVRTGHTTSRLSSVLFDGCGDAFVDLTGVNSLTSGDWQNGSTAFQDDLVDVVDFSILATLWNVPADRTSSIGADATGDGQQNTPDFTVLQVNFLSVSDLVDACPVASSGGNSRLTISEIELVQPLSMVQVEDLWMIDSAEKADMNNDGFIDLTDMVIFAKMNRLPLLPEFQRLVNSRQSGSHKSKRSQR